MSAAVLPRYPRAKIMSALSRGLTRREFSLMFQPQVRTSDRSLYGIEALIRWTDPELGHMSPADFVPIAEHSGLIHELGLWALEEACRQARRWQLDGLAIAPISVNVSPLQLDVPDFPGQVREVLRSTGLAAGHLNIEITESHVLADPQRTLPTLHALKAQGIQLSLDDFGTGFSALGYLQLYPFDHLKLDRSFVGGLPGSAGCSTLCRTIVNLAHELDMSVVAEGVEDEAQFRFLKQLRCDAIQGYLISRPASAEELPRWAAEQREGSAAH